MILFLDYSAGGRRGGEAYTQELFSFLHKYFGEVVPKFLSQRPPEFKSIIKNALSSYRLVKKIRPKIVETDISSGLRNILAISWAKRHNIGILIVIQERRVTYRLKNLIFAKWLVRACENYLLKNADIILANSEYIVNFAKSKAKKNAIIIKASPGLQINELPGILTRPSLGGQNNRLELLFVGECTEPRKGVRYLLEAIALLKDIDLRLNLAGEYKTNSSIYQVLRKIIACNELEGKVKFHGFLEKNEMKSLYGNSDIFVLPSLMEGYGMALAEAISNGLPVVASRVGAIPEMVNDGINGILVPPRDSHKLADAIRLLASDFDMRRRINIANAQKAKSLPSWADFEGVLEKSLVTAIQSLIKTKSQ